ncbi:MAG: Ldh family oxidoreductase [Candidatus Latescibacterota bacterium]|nr:Ldh family oxidoreductase [Candidatus Latescibacterota bacterium]
MPRFSPDTLTEVGVSLFTACGCSAEDAHTVTEHLVESSLFGHDSHGTLRFYEYVEQIRDGIFAPQGTPKVVQERGVTAVIDGGGTMGQIGGRFAVEVAAAKARELGVASIGLRNCAHLGRIGAYPLALARQGLVGLAFVNAGRLGRQIAPYGGLDGKLSTNPVAFAAPRSGHDPILVDMTTSVVAEGKVRVYSNRGDHLPEGWIIDRDGEPSTDPADYLGEDGGAILPLGGVVAYKGYCLSMIVEIFGGIFSGQGTAAGDRIMQSNGLLLTAYDPSFFAVYSDYQREMEGLVAHVLSSRVDPRIGEIKLPGEPEFRSERERRAQGIPIDDTTWARICERARELGLNPEPWIQAAI